MHNPYSYTLILCLTAGIAISFSSLPGLSQTNQQYELSVSKIGAEEGLANLFVRQSMKDSRGFVWISTNGGLYSYDGENAQPIITKLDKNLFRAGFANEGPNGNIWVCSNNLALFKTPLGSSFAVWLVDKEQPISGREMLEQTKAPFQEEAIETFISTANNGLVFLLNDGSFYLFDGEHYTKIGQIEPNNEYDSRLKMIAQQIIPPQQLDTCLIFNLKNGAVREVPNFQEQETLLDLYDYYYYCKKDTLVEIQFPNRPAVEPITIAPPDQTIIALELSKNKLLWAVTLQEVVVYAPVIRQGGTHYQQIARKAIDISASIFQHLRTGEQGNSAWIATANGLLHVQLNIDRFDSFRDPPNKIIDPRGITSDEQGTIYFNDYYFFKYESDSLHLLLHNFQGLGLLYEKGVVWSGHFGSEVSKIDLETLQTHSFASPPNRISTTWLHRSQRSGALYVGSNKGLFVRQHKADTLTELRLNSLVDQSEIGYIHENQKGLWLCTTQGLFLYDEGRNTCLDYSYVTQSTAVNHLYETPEGEFWLGTFGQGLLHWAPGAPSATTYNYQDGLTDEQILAVYPDEYGLLWMPTNNGLIRFDPDTKDAITFTTKDGLPHNEFNLYSHHQTQDGTLVFGTIKGLIKFHPSQFPKEFQNNYAKVRVIRMEKTSPNAKTEQLSVNTEAVVLNKSTETLRLRFVLLDYSTTGLEEFDYRVLGQTDQWAPMRNSTLHLSGLPYGDFRLEVRGHTSKETYSKDVYQLSIRVPLPFYRESWFFLLSIVSLGVLIFFIIRWRTHQLQQEKIHLQGAIRQRTKKIHQQATTLQKLSQAKTSFIANITHELRTPLTMISGALQLLNTNQHPKPKSGLKAIERNVDRLIHLVDELIDVNQSEKAILKVKAAPANIKMLSTIAFQNYEEEARLQRTQYTLQLSDDLAETYLADQQKIEHVIHNLLSNAFKYTPKDGKIALKIYPGKPTGIIIQVEDNGPGISPEVQSRIFERYYQAESGVSGMGLGLSIVQDYVAAMSGQVSLESKPGEGTAFLITLPLQVVQKNGTQASQGKSVNNVVPNPSSDIQPIEPDILIVEDNTEVQSLLVDIFQHQYSLRVMDDGQMALSYLQSATKLPSLIITDLMMPKLDGISFIKILKADHRYALLPILVLSAVNTPLTKINALTIGVDDYINKPFRIEELRAIATTILKNAAARLEATKEASDLLPTENATGDHNINQYEKEWLEKTEAILWDMVKKGKDVKVKDFANTLHISERQLQRQIKQFVGLTPVEYINEIRLQRARQLIDNKTYSTVAEVAYEVGYAYPNYFSRIFTKRFGQPPSHFFKS